MSQNKVLEYDNCPIRQVVSKFGDKWSMLVLSTLDQHESGVMRYSEIQRQMTDCSQKMLSQTLRNLEASHLISRKAYPEVPPRVEYALTDLGRSLMPSINSLIQWALDNFERVIVA
ncbi:MAG: helix-turn-helix transcriptional regulator [Prevotella sp.]|nr:helix-turn-helix transcriptional regulator [Prevotella sp.]